jgi:signal transduction histidine kinase
VTTTRSLRTRITVAAAVWSFGLLAATGVLQALLLFRPDFWRNLHGALLAILGFACLLAGVAQVRFALRPLAELRERLAAVRTGAARRLEGAYPSEVQPLVDDLNALLAHQERMVARARAQAGDLAHGLKTPLAVLALEADQLAAAGAAESAETVERQVALMREQVEHRLAEARVTSAAQSGGAAPVEPSLERLARTMRILHARRGLVIDVACAAGDAFRGQSADLEEMAGNLLDNACKWARSTVAVRAWTEGGRLTLTVEDDGPGLEGDELTRVLERGTRADEATPGSGLGLAIVRDYAELYGGTIALARGASGGLRATLVLPAAG